MLVSFAASVPAFSSPMVRASSVRVQMASSFQEERGWTDEALGAKIQAEADAAEALKATYQPMQLKDMIGGGPETGASQPWDPLNLSGDNLVGSIDKLAWLRAAEIKHGRVAMAAFVGYVVTASGNFWPGAINYEGTLFSELGKDPFVAWDAMGQSARSQIIGTVGLMNHLHGRPGLVGNLNRHRPGCLLISLNAASQVGALGNRL